MAEQKKQLKIFKKGLNKDFNSASQPIDTYRDALDMIQSSSDGDIYSLVTEKGNKEILNFPEGCQIIGHDNLGDDIIFFGVNTTEKTSNVVEFTISGVDDGSFHGITDIVEIVTSPSGTATDPSVPDQGNGAPGTATTNTVYRDQVIDRINTEAVFQAINMIAFPVGTDKIRMYSKSETSIDSINIGHAGSVILTLAGYTGFSKIGVVDSNDTYTSIIDNPELGFTLDNQIEARSRIRFDGHRITYFTDDNKDMRAVDLDDPPVNNFNELTSLVFKFGVPVVEFGSIVETGGSVPVGSYQFIARYLTSDLDETSFGFSSQIIPMVDEDRSVGRTEYDGASIDTPTNKLINFNVTNIDVTGNFQFIEVAVIRYPGAGADGDLVIPTIEIFERQEISGSTMTFKYTGPQTSDVPVDLSEVVKQSTNYSRAKCVEQKDDRLYFSNLSSDVNHDFQAIANGVTVKYVVEEISAVQGQPTEFDDYKGEEQTFDKKSYHRQEVYSLAIGFLLTNGSATTAYHIPGTDLSSNTPGRNDSTTTSTGVGNTTGALGTFISTKKYPSGQGYPTTGGVPDNVRHHIMPTLSQEPHFKQNSVVTIRVLGLKLTDINIPATLQGQIQGYFIMRERRDTPENKSIIAQGLAQTHVRLTGAKYTGLGQDVAVHKPGLGYYTNAPFLGHTRIQTGGRVFFKGGKPTGGQGINDVNGNDNAKNLVSFFSPESILQAQGESVPRLDVTDFNAIKPVLGLKGAIVTQRNIKNSYSEKKLIGFDRGFHGVQHISANYIEHSDLTASEQTITKSVYLSNKSSEGAGTTFSTLGFDSPPFTGTEILGPFDSQGYLCLFLGSDLNQPATIDTDIFLDHTLDSNVPVNVINNDSTQHPNNNESERYLYNLVRLTGDQYGDVTSAKYVMINHTFNIFQDEITCFNGDTFITSFSYKNCNMLSLESNPYGNQNKSHNLLPNRDIGANGYEMRALAIYWVESNINTNYRHVIPSGVPYFPKEGLISAGISPITGANGEVNHPQAQPSGSNPSQGVLDVVPELGESRYYNFLYSKEDKVRIFSPKPLAFIEVGDFPNRTIYSDAVVAGEQKDNYRVFKVNSFKDIPKNKGPINDTFVWENILYLHTSKSLWRTYINETALVQTTSGESMVVGSGGLFDRPEKEILTLDGGYAGTKSQWAGVNTPYGRFFVDIDQKKIFQFTGKLKEISSQGLWKFLLEKMEITDNDVDDNDKKDNPANPANGGYVSGFDYKNKRLIVTKKVRAVGREGFGEENIKLIGRDQLIELKNEATLIDTDLFTFQYNTPIIPFFLQNSFVRLPATTNLDAGFTIYICNEYVDVHSPILDFTLQVQAVTGTAVLGLVEFGECAKLVLQSDGTWTFTLVSKTDIIFLETTENRFTISYSPVTQTWISRHSWFPTNMLSRAERFFSINNDVLVGNEGLWEHGAGDYGKFYLSTVANHVVIFVINIDAANTKTHENLILHTQAYDEDDKTYELTETFDGIEVYNETQHTGPVTLTVGSSGNIRWREDKFRLTIPRDAVINVVNNIFSPSNQNQALEFKAKMRSKYALVKLSYSNPNNMRLVLNAIDYIFSHSTS